MYLHKVKKWFSHAAKLQLIAISLRGSFLYFTSIRSSQFIYFTWCTYISDADKLPVNSMYSTTENHHIKYDLPIMTLLLTNDLPLFQPFGFLYDFFPFSKGKDTIIWKTTKSWIIWIYLRCETKCCGIEVSLWSYIVPLFDKGMFGSFYLIQNLIL